MGELLSVTDAAEVLGCSRGHVYGLIAAGDLSAVDIKPTGSTRTKTRVFAAELEEFIAARTRRVSKNGGGGVEVRRIDGT